MKKYIKQIILFAFVASFVACTEDEEVPMTSVGGSISGLTTATPGSITRLDNTVPITFKITTKEGVAATSVEVYKNTAASSTAAIVLGDKVADATIGTDGKTAVYNSSALGPFTFANNATTGSFPLAVRATFSDGTSTLIPYVQTIAKAIVWKTLNASGSPVTSTTSGVTSFKLNDPTPVNIRIAAVKNAATTLTSVVASASKNGGAYVDLPVTLLANTTTQVIDIAAIPYSTYGGLEVDDEITYKFTVTAGTQSDFITTKVTVADQVFSGSNSGALSQADAMNQFSFETGENYPDDSTDGEIIFNPNFGFKAATTSTITFVENSGLDFEDANLFDAKTAYNAGTPVTSVNGLAVNKVILYKITRDTDSEATTYGLIKVTQFSLVTASTEIQEIKFDYKEGELFE